MKNSYVVCVKSPSDWSEIHKLLLLDGTLEDNLPSRACECVDAKEVYDNVATYLLDDEEAEAIKQHEKVKWVELDPAIHPESDRETVPTEFRFGEGGVKLYRGAGSITPSASPPKGVVNVDATGSSRDGTDVVFAISPDRELDISYFPGGGKRPVVIGIHGGMFYAGDKDSFDEGTGYNKGNYFTGLGYNYVSLNYRLIENNNLTSNISGSVVNTAALDFTSTDWTDRNTVDQQLNDLALGIRYVVDNAGQWGLDADNIILFGHSSGAHLVAQLSTNKSYLDNASVDIGRIKGSIILDVKHFDLKGKLTGFATDVSQNSWEFMNAYGVHPNISAVDFASVSEAESYWSQRSPLENIQNISKPKTDYAKSFCVITRGTSSRRSESEDFKKAIVQRGIANTFLDYAPVSNADITDGTTTYDHEGIHKVLGGTDIPDGNSAFDHITHDSVSTEIKTYLNSVVIPLASELNRSSWYLARLQQKQACWPQDEFQPNIEPFSGGNVYHVNRHFIGIPKQSNIEYTSLETGAYVDAVIIDNGAWHGHPEFVDDAGVSQIKDIVLDGPYYLDKEYFDTNSKTTIFLGRTTCTEAAAKEWWTDVTKRSSELSSAPTLSSGSIPAAYTRANICGDYSNYPSHAGTESSFANHGTPVASSVYGKNFGWAFGANKWNVAANVGFSSLIYVSKIYEILKIFVDNKPSVSGIKYPTVINSSYASVTYVANEWAAGTYFYKFREEASASFTNKATAPEFLKNFIDDDNSRYGDATSSASHQEAGDALANTPGVVWFASAGNANQNTVLPGDPDYNNLWSTSDPDLDTFDPATAANYVNRRSSPGNFGYNSEENYYNVIYVGALAAALNEDRKECKDWYSSSGTGVDVLSPASGGLAAAGNTSQETYPRYDSQDFYSWLSKDVFDCEIGGTSTASPVIAGLIASKLTSFYYWTAKSVRKYIEGLVQNQRLTSFNEGYGEITTSNSSEWVALDNLYGQEPKVVYNVAPTPLSFQRGLPGVIELENKRDPFTFEVRLGVPLASSYSYQWEKSDDGGIFYSVIPNQTSNSITFTTIDSSVLDKFYRVRVISDGPYALTYSSSSLLKLKSSVLTIVSQPIDTKATQGGTATLSVVATTTSSNSLVYQWQKFNESGDEWEVVTGATLKKLIIKDVDLTTSGSYRCVVSDENSDPVISNAATLRVIVPELEFILEPRNVKTFIGNSATLVSKAISTTSATISLQWQFSTDNVTWANISGEKDSSLELTNLLASQEGYYRCRAVDNVSVNSPEFSASIKIDIEPVVLTIVTTKLDTTVIEGSELSLQVGATINDRSRVPSFSFQKRYYIGSVERWRVVEVNSTGIFFIRSIAKEQQGRYRCVVSHSLANNSPQIVSPIDIGVLDSFEVSQAYSSPTLAIVDNDVSLTATVKIINDNISFFYIWERKDSGSTDWNIINSAQDQTFTFKATGKDYLSSFRCKVTNSLGTVKYTSPDFQLTFSPFVDVVEDLQKDIIFKENSEQTHILDPEVVSTHLSTVTYVWQKSYDNSTWSDISTETNKALELTPAKIASLNAGNVDDFYFVRLKIIFGQTSTTSFSEPTKIDLKDAYNLFGDCLNKTASDNLYNTDSLDSRVAHGADSLPDRQYIETINIDPVGPTDKCKDKNTCGISIDELFETYQIYNTQKGLYKSWGDIEFVWQLEEARDPSGVTCNLNTTETDDKWQIAQYKALYAYFPKIEAGGLASPADATCLTERPADRVLRIEDDGYKVSLYEAQELVTSLAGPFDKTKWKKICHVITSVPAGLPTPEEIKERYEPYELDFFLKEWEEYNATWDEDFYQQSFDQCRNTNSVLADIEKCMKEKNGPYGQSNDQWEQARIRKDFFYKVGDYVWIEGECKDTICLYICIEDIPATRLIFDELKQFKTGLRPSSDAINYAVTVQNVSAGNRYFIDGSQQPTLNLTEGQTYRFNQDNSSNTNHPVRFSTTPNGTHGGGIEFTQGVTKVGTAGSIGAYTEITIPVGTPTLYYYCANHSLMGGTSNTIGLTFWQRVYCVNTGMNKCLEPQRERDLPNYQLIELGSLGHYVEQPLPFFDLKGKKLCNDFEILNDVVEVTEPKVLTQEEIDALDQP